MGGDWITLTEQKLRISLENIRLAHNQSEQRIAPARDAVARYIADHGLTQTDQSPQIVAFGSMARFEMSDGSDFDYLVVLNGLVDHPEEIREYRLAANAAFEALGLDAPGASGLFGSAVSGSEFVNTIGLDGDTNLHMSRRVLLLQESIGLTDPTSHKRLIDAVITRYLFGTNTTGVEVPRFLLNDVIRFWRTMAVDYEGKRWDDLTGKKANIRYVKLLSSRKLTYVASIVALFWPALSGSDEPVSEQLSMQFQLPALPRIAQLRSILHDDDLPALASILEAADWFLGLLADAAKRQLLTMPDDEANVNQQAVLKEAKRKADELNLALSALLFSEPKTVLTGESLGSLSKRYLVY